MRVMCGAIMAGMMAAAVGAGCATTPCPSAAGPQVAVQPRQGELGGGAKGPPVEAGALDPESIAEAAGTESVEKEGVVRIGWTRDDVPVQVDGMDFEPAAGLGSWAAFKSTGADTAMVMGDTVVFQDEVDAAMDAAFAHGLAVTALHNHFFFDRPKVYFMHIGGQGQPDELAAGVRAVWEAIRSVREARPEPAVGFGGAAPKPGTLDTDLLSQTLGHEVERKAPGVAKVSVARRGAMSGVAIGGPMGLSSWAAFTGSDDLVAMDGDLIMKAEEVQPVLRVLRSHGVHVVALHNHMIGEQPTFYFTHFWGKGTVAEMARAFRAALDVLEG